MEAKYADGSNAGPDNWTPYKMFDSSFAPNYSGATVTYIVTKSGNRVIGTTS